MRFMSSTDRVFLAVGIAAGIGLASPAFADRLSLECPAAIVTTQTAAALSNWEVSDLKAGDRQRLRAAVFTDGHPKDLAVLKPAAEKKTKSGTRVVYRFDGGFAQGIWLQCSYENTKITVQQKLAGPAKSCTVNYLKAPGPEPVIQGITCD
jgi:hypothetical protein